MQSAGGDDKQDLLGGHRIFLKDIGEIVDAATRVDNAREGVNSAKLSLGARLFMRNGVAPKRAQASSATTSIPKERRDIFEQARQRKPSDGELAFFGTYCHDSYAGFKPFDVAMVRRIVSRNAPWEDGGYLRYRTRYAGENLRLAMLKSCPQDSASVAAA